MDWLLLLRRLAAAWAGAQAFAACYYGAFYLLRRREREYAVFAALSGCFALHSLGTALILGADSVAEASMGQKLTFLGGIAATGPFADYLEGLMERRTRLTTLGYVITVVSSIAVCAGLSVDPAFPAPDFDGGTVGPGNLPGGRLSPAFNLAAGAAILLSGWLVFQLLRGARRERELRIPALGAVVALTLGTYDAYANYSNAVPRLATTSHGIMFLVLSLNYALLDRFARTDRALTERTEALARSVGRLQAAQRSLVRTKQLAAVGELSAVIAHELKNPLAIIKNATSSLRKVDRDTEDGATLLTILDEEADHLNRLVVDLLAYAQPVQARAEKVDIGRLVERAVEAVLASRPRLGDIITRDHRIELDSPEIDGDASLLHHALVNIVDNAVQAMPEGGSLRIRCRPIERHGRPAVAIEVRDTGKGMDATIRERAVDPFFTTRETGTGLGLAIVERIAKAHRGRLKIESRAGHGTTVRLLLPRSTGAPQDN